ncbi:uncharacterized protein EAF01_005559 [Botrytis porri]|uniref:diphosphoinositol-polyphosphate diphosphatase n=1 Tax=Botrytis porri TaxID=87229 RepID=A0A4Z1KX73_9HELO|nr:uncharacterized protein EAF01_005559 [Botrytis porri]KAF7905038.1 hypothetical protein EAF01_005559 [Botrytis porri]TGO89056.1 hypothetical protein BPOR_0127g00120 [Botrytis porri]
MADELVAKISRRSTRIFATEQEVMQSGNASAVGITMVPHEARYSSSQDEKDREKEKDKKHREARSTSHQTPLKSADVGKDLGTLFPAKIETIATQATKSVDTTKALAKEKQKDKEKEKEKHDLNFGVIAPNAIYRSSFPQQEDFEYLGTLGLKSIVTLVKKDFPPEFLAFMEAHGIRHYVIEMQGTKKVDIPEHIMNQIMRISLDKENHPLLIHCNHGKHRTGCAAAIIRHVSGWSVESIVEEYKAFAAPKARDVDIKYITEYHVSRLSGLDRNQSVQPTAPKSFKKARPFALAVLLIWIYMNLMRFWDH